MTKTKTQLAELAERHQQKKESPFGDPNPSGTEFVAGETTRANRQPGVLPPGANKLPASSAGLHHNKPEKSAHGGSFESRRPGPSVSYAYFGPSRCERTRGQEIA
jgi:hypothetical protein